jgi:hypothetical protein
MRGRTLRAGRVDLMELTTVILRRIIQKTERI